MSNIAEGRHHACIRHDHEGASRLAPERSHDGFNFGVTVSRRCNRRQLERSRCGRLSNNDWLGAGALASQRETPSLLLSPRRKLIQGDDMVSITRRSRDIPGTYAHSKHKSEQQIDRVPGGPAFRRWRRPPLKASIAGEIFFERAGPFPAPSSRGLDGTISRETASALLVG